MPELPEVETVRRGLEPAMVQKKMVEVIVNRHDLRGGIPHDFSDVMRGQVIRAMIRRGKYILAFTENGAGFVLHLGMSGRVRIYDPSMIPTTQKHDHVIFKISDGSHIVFNDPRRFGMLYLTSEERWRDEKPFNLMGPEPLSNTFSGQALKDKLTGKKTAIKQALLDQRVVSGVGNIYACEALYDAGVDPFRPSHTLREDECEKLAHAVRDVLSRAIESGGSTLRDYAQTDGSLGYFQHSFHVYDREGTSCPACECDIRETSGIQRIMQGGRSTFYCPRKQG